MIVERFLHHLPKSPCTAKISSFATTNDVAYLLAQMNCKNQMQKSNLMQYVLQVHFMEFSPSKIYLSDLAVPLLS